MPEQHQNHVLKRGLKNRHIQLIALGGAIGTGLFLGIAQTIQLAGPAVLLGYAIAGVIAFFVREKERKPVSHVSFGERLRLLPRPYRKFLVAVGIFGAGDFAPTLLILLATQKLAPALGAPMAASVAVGFYVLRNFYYAGFAYVAGWLAESPEVALREASGVAHRKCSINSPASAASAILRFFGA